MDVTRLTASLAPMFSSFDGMLEREHQVLPK
jgi:hypothetical protein